MTSVGSHRMIADKEIQSAKGDRTVLEDSHHSEGRSYHDCTSQSRYRGRPFGSDGYPGSWIALLVDSGASFLDCLLWSVDHVESGWCVAYHDQKLVLEAKTFVIDGLDENRLRDPSLCSSSLYRVSVPTGRLSLVVTASVGDRMFVGGGNGLLPPSDGVFLVKPVCSLFAQPDASILLMAIADDARPDCHLSACPPQ